MIEFIGEYRILAPTVMYIIGFLLMMIVSLTTCKKHNLSKLNAFLFTLVSYVGGVAGAMFMGDQFTKVAVRYGGLESKVAIFGAVMFVPIFIIGAALIFGKPWRNVMDTMAPGGFIILTCAKFGCFIYGCCPGLPCEFGLYNPVFDMVMFPSQIFETVSMCFVVAFCFWYGLKYKNRVTGKSYPYTIMLYSVVRFAWEFIRYYDVEEMRHMFLGLTFWQLWCIVTFFEGLIWLLVMKHPRFNEFEDKYYIIRSEFVDKLILRIKCENKKDNDAKKIKNSKKNTWHNV